MPTLTELKTTAQALGLAVKSKITKSELEEKINNELNKKSSANNAALLRATRSIEPMSSAERESHYRSASNGGSNLTAKQQRRLQKKRNKQLG